MRVYPSQWMCLNFLRNNQGLLRIGWTISRRVASAVVRNKMRRWSRQYFRQEFKNECDLCVDINIILRPRDGNFYKDLKYKEFIEIFKKGLQLISKMS